MNTFATCTSGINRQTHNLATHFFIRNNLRWVLSVLVAAAPITASAENWNWQYFGPYDKNIGVPTNMINISNDIPSTLKNNVFLKLPEGKDIRKNNPNLITDDLGANLYFVENAEVTVAFLHEGAGFRNSLGFFTFDPKNRPATSAPLYNDVTKNIYNQKILFPNFSALGSGGALKVGDGLYLGKFQAGQAMGFTIVSNGYTNNTSVNPKQPASGVFYTIKSWNPESATNNLNAHTVLLSDPADGILALGFEDTNRAGGDHDFNDVIMVISVTPDTAIDRSRITALNEVKDTDGDSVPDALDVYPKDPERAFRKFYPSATGTGFGFVAFEDNWPRKGDNDMNDLVVAYRVIETLNAKKEVTALKLTYRMVARGAAYANGFGLHLPGIPASNIKLTAADAPEPTNIIVGDGAPQLLTPEAGQAEAVFILAQDTSLLTKSSGQGCKFFNTMPDCPYDKPVEIIANIQFKSPQPSVGTAPYNPFIYINGNRGMEVHLVDNPPTAKADTSQFGQGDDRSDAAKGRYYRTANNHPWALEIPEDWQYPSERKEITVTYPKFAGWAESGGANNKDWFQSNINQNAVYKAK